MSFLLCEYSASSSSSDDGDSDHEGPLPSASSFAPSSAVSNAAGAASAAAVGPKLTPPSPRSFASHTLSQVLPSADELFSSDKPLRPPPPSTTSSSKRKTTSGVGAASSGPAERSDAASKRQRALEAAPGYRPAGPTSKQKLPFAPPQLKRPNVSTEDRAAWNTAKTMALQQRRQAGQADAEA